jgi:protein-S-isoprenylcysteine O-methyltransferase Ste14
MLKQIIGISFFVSLYFHLVYFSISLQVRDFKTEKDMQKTIELEYHKGHLIQKRLWSISRNPNYFGELLIYTGFNLLSKNIFPFLVLFLGIVTVWLPNMKKKDKSLSRFKEFPEYEKKTALWIPYIY